MIACISLAVAVTIVTAADQTAYMKIEDFGVTILPSGRQAIVLADAPDTRSVGLPASWNITLLDPYNNTKVRIGHMLALTTWRSKQLSSPQTC